MKRKWIILLVILILLPTGLLGADYFGLLGVKTGTRLDFAEVQFKIVEEKTGAPIFGTRVRCVQKGNDNACTIKDKSSDDVITILFPKHLQVTRSHLFTLNETYIEPAVDDLYIFFINNDYHTINMKFSVKELLSAKSIVQNIKMSSRTWQVEEE